jgi:hypothetical protein
VEWESGDQQRGVRWPGSAINGEVPVGLRSPEDSAKSSSVITATEVIRRLKALMRDDSLLMACLRGPFTLGALLSNADVDGELHAEDVSNVAVAFSAAAIARIASVFAEAGANVIFIRENALPAPSTEVFSDWNSSLSSIVNIIRFYEALPILLVTDPGAANANRSEMFSQIRDCITCPANDGGQPARLSAGAEKENPARGVALALELFNSQEFPAEASDGALRCMISNGNPAVITTAGDVAATVDVKRLNKIWEFLHCS